MLLVVVIFFLTTLWGMWDLTSWTRDRTKAPTVKVLSPNHCTTRKFLVLFSQRSPRPSSRLIHRRTPKSQDWLHPPPIYIYMLCSVTQFCLTLQNPMMNCSLPGSSVHGVSQARMLEWVPISLSINPRVTGRVTLYCSTGAPHCDASFCGAQARGVWA